MAKKQTRRSISVSRVTYERLKAFCEANSISMSQLVETRVNDFLGEPTQPLRPVMPSPPRVPAVAPPVPKPPPVEAAKPAVLPITSAAVRYAVEPPPPTIVMKPTQAEAAPKPPEKRPEQIFTF